MSRHVDLGNDRHIPIGTILHDLRVLVLRVEPAGPAAYLRGACHGSEIGARFDLDAPALIVGKMKMQHVHLVKREEIDVLIDLVRSEEMACDIEHGASPCETGPI